MKHSASQTKENVTFSLNRTQHVAAWEFRNYVKMFTTSGRRIRSDRHAGHSCSDVGVRSSWHQHGDAIFGIQRTLTIPEGCSARGPLSAPRLYLLSGDDQPTCSTCGHPLTVRHILTDCSLLISQDVRRRHFSATCVGDLFYVNTGIVMDFIKDIHF